MLAWLGIKNEPEEQRTKQFFAGASKKTVFMTLIASLVIFGIVKMGLVALLPKETLDDTLGAVLPGTIGLLVALLVVGVVERISSNK